MDYVVARSTNHNCEPKLIASYDIMCQWATNLGNRLNKFPVAGSGGLNERFVARVVPKFHLAAHRPECRANFSLNFEPGVGRKDMEGPERTWFGLQGGGSTKDQGPGFWSDTMDDKFSHWNWMKLVSLGKTAFLNLQDIPDVDTPRTTLQKKVPQRAHPGQSSRERTHIPK